MSQSVLPDPILLELEEADLRAGHCRGRTARGKRCRRVAPLWWDRSNPWYCRSHLGDA